MQNTPKIMRNNSRTISSNSSKARLLVNHLPSRTPKKFQKKNSLSITRQSNCYETSKAAAKKTLSNIVWENTISSTKVKKKNPPQITSKCWAIYDFNKMSIIHGKREYQRREVASLTKIMTCYVVIKLCKQFRLDPKTTEVTISDVAADIRGTTANLQTNDVLSVE